MIKVKVLFGENEVNEYLQTNEVPENGTVKEYEFKTPEELEAFLYGLDEAVGWHNYIAVEEGE